MLSGQLLPGETWSVILYAALLGTDANDTRMYGILVSCCPGNVMHPHTIPFAGSSVKVMSLQMTQDQHHKYLKNAQLCSGGAAERCDCWCRPEEQSAFNSNAAGGHSNPVG